MARRKDSRQEKEAPSRVKPLYIAVEGCIGIGKTTLARKLARFRRAGLMLEPFQENPFLTDFYRDPIANAFETEMQFLLLHYHHLRKLARSARTEVVADFTFFKDKVFAELTLRDRMERSFFSRMYLFLCKRLVKPDVVIYLTGTDGLIIDRIRDRNRSMEQDIDVRYFKKLKRKLDHFFLKLKPRALIVDADEFDCIGNPTLVEELSRQIDAKLSARAVNKLASRL